MILYHNMINNFNIFSGPDKFYDPALLMAPYLMNSYAVAAYAANNVSKFSIFINFFKC